MPGMLGKLGDQRLSAVDLSPITTHFGPMETISATNARQLMPHVYV